MRVSVCLGAILILEYLDFHSGYSTPRSRIAGIYSGIYSGINSYSGISQTNAPLIWGSNLKSLNVSRSHKHCRVPFYCIFLVYNSMPFHWTSEEKSRRRLKKLLLKKSTYAFSRDLNFTTPRTKKPQAKKLFVNSARCTFLPRNMIIVAIYFFFQFRFFCVIFIFWGGGGMW